MKRTGFTLIEMLVVLAVIAALSTFLVANLIEASKQSHDADRKADLVAMQTAIELYKQKYGRYPEGCNGPNTWSGQIGTDFECGDGTGVYIRGLSEYVAVLPQDNYLNGTNSGYRYLTNAERSVYKLMAYNTVESETVDHDTELRSCDVNADGTGICNGGTPNWCRLTNPIFQRSYGVWGGFADGADSATVEANTRAIICEIP